MRPTTAPRWYHVRLFVLPMLLLLATLLPAFYVTPSYAQPTAAAAYVGDYSPNTRIEMRGSELWFVRTPYESALQPTADGTYIFATGWLVGRQIKFVPNEANGISILLQSDDGNWNEFARSGEIYDDLDPSLRAALAHMLEHEIEQRGLPAVTLYVHIPGQGMWVGARGVSNRELGIPAVPLDRWRIASVSKVFLAVVVLQLVDEGVITLDDSVERWLPGLVPNGHNITVRQLLNHTSGLYNYMNDYFISQVLADRGRMWSPYELVAFANAYPPYFAPGQPERWHYSNTNYVLLGLIVEHATGLPLAQNIRSRISEPLGLYNTFYEPQETIPGSIMRGYLGNRDITSLNLSYAWGCGSMVSSAEDLGKFTRAMFRGTLLSPERMQDMRSFVPVYGAWHARYLTYGLGLMHDRMGIAHATDGQPRAEGLAWVDGHTGALAGYRSAMWYMPERGITIAVGLNQMYTDANHITTAALNTILAYQEQTGRISSPSDPDGPPPCRPDSAPQPCQ
ncbi:MAG: beta-lactamase family protein [Chloroflexaceae bacterium]|nr:beta-lactamase family protein [Chloroflexaceae bacterium]